MKTFKLILKSLISNNACIEGGRKKPWYFAAIMFFLSMIFAILPLFVQTWKTNGDDVFASYAYGADVATLRFTEHLESSGLKMYVKTASDGTKFISCEDSTGAAQTVNYSHYLADGTTVDFNFFYRTELNEDEFKVLLGDQKTSTMLIYQDRIILHLVNFGTKESIKDMVCQNAAKYMEEGRSVNDLLSKESDATTRLNDTFANWKLFIRDAYNFTRLTGVWQTCVIMGSINIGITLFMGFMIWVLTRGKNNPYRSFNLWHTQKMSWWAAITPSLLALGFGFLLPRFANILFPMLIGIRVMWLSMKSLRPDGTGYVNAD